MARSKLELLFYEAKQKPEIRKLVDNIMNLSDQDIMNAKVPLPWFRIALRELKEKKLKEIQTGSLRMNDPEFHNFVLNNTKLSLRPDPNGDIYQWKGEPVFVQSGASQVEVKTNALLWKTDGVLLYETAKLTNEKAFQAGNLIWLETASYTQYIAKYKAAISLNINLPPTPQYPSSGFKITKH